MSQPTISVSKIDVPDVVEDNAMILSRKVPGWAAGMGLVLLTIFTGLWFLREPLVAIVTNQADINNIKAQLEHCHKRHEDMEKAMSELRADLAAQRADNSELRRRILSLEQRQPFPLPQ